MVLVLVTIKEIVRMNSVAQITLTTAIQVHHPQHVTLVTAMALNVETLLQLVLVYVIVLEVALLLYLKHALLTKEQIMTPPATGPIPVPGMDMKLNVVLLKLALTRVC
jgi:hypothetical protein